MSNHVGCSFFMLEFLAFLLFNILTAKETLLVLKKVGQYLLSKEIKLAKYAGFCYGVKRAVLTAKKLKEENPDKKVCIFGELIHNADVIRELENLGIITLYEIPEHVENAICIIRSHGATPEILKQLENAGFEIHDLTCLDVKKVQQKAMELVKDDYFLIIVGKAEHPEVMAIKAHAEQFGKNILVASSVEELREHANEIKSQKIGVVVQTTQRMETLNSIIEYLLSVSKELKIYNTICLSTSHRQNEARELAKENDLVLVVGSKKSANTTHLAEILTNLSKTIHIENADELEKYKDIIDSSEKIAVTAGASTPDYIIENVINTIKGGK